MPTLRAGLGAVLAVVACPCHVPLIIALVAGTTFGATLANHAGLLYGAMTALFVGALVFGFARIGRTNNADENPAGEGHCEDCTVGVSRPVLEPQKTSTDSR